MNSSKFQRISAIITPEFADVHVLLFDVRFPAVTTPKTQLEVPASVNEDEHELLLIKT